jgi:probable rRNA maturation factor
MIEYTTVGEFTLEEEQQITDWVQFTLDSEEKELGELNYIFCDDNYLHDINVKTLNHNTLTDIISFDYTQGQVVSGDVFISYERVRENSKDFDLKFRDELHRVMIHGVLHYCGYKDKLDDEKTLMRAKEDYYLSLRTF